MASHSRGNLARSYFPAMEAPSGYVCMANGCRLSWSWFLFGITLPETNSKSSENRPLEVWSFLFGNHPFEGRNVSFRECMLPKHPMRDTKFLRIRGSHHMSSFSLKITRCFLSFKSESLQPGKCHFSMSPHKTCCFFGTCLVWETFGRIEIP